MGGERIFSLPDSLLFETYAIPRLNAVINRYQLGIGLRTLAVHIRAMLADLKNLHITKPSQDEIDAFAKQYGFVPA